MIELIEVSKGYATKQSWHWVLNDVTLRLPRRNIGILGLNGAGKSTLIRLLCGVEPATRGKIVRNVRVSWPLGFSGGFQSSLTGRENAQFIARIYGANPEPFVAYAGEFAELGKFFDLPIRAYSSGMRARLAFAVSLAADFDCYLVDEVTAVGDQRFKKKYRAAFEERKGRANIIMVSHSPGTIRRDCDMGAVLHDGKILLFDEVEEAIAEYVRLNKLPRSVAAKRSVKKKRKTSKPTGKKAGSKSGKDASESNRAADKKTPGDSEPDTRDADKTAESDRKTTSRAVTAAPKEAIAKDERSEKSFSSIS